ncbi:MAG TPA: hypothetical protein PK156_41650 [Polyangium sp.]|nr:hypothetical protein [Polyangium sp.]
MHLGHAVHYERIPRPSNGIAYEDLIAYEVARVLGANVNGRVPWLQTPRSRSRAEARAKRTGPNVALGHGRFYDKQHRGNDQRLQGRVRQKQRRAIRDLTTGTALMGIRGSIDGYAGTSYMGHQGLGEPATREPQWTFPCARRS